MVPGSPVYNVPPALNGFCMKAHHRGTIEILPEETEVEIAARKLAESRAKLEYHKQLIVGAEKGIKIETEQIKKGEAALEAAEKAAVESEKKQVSENVTKAKQAFKKKEDELKAAEANLKAAEKAQKGNK